MSRHDDAPGETPRAEGQYRPAAVTFLAIVGVLALATAASGTRAGGAPERWLVAAGGVTALVVAASERAHRPGAKTGTRPPASARRHGAPVEAYRRPASPRAEMVGFGLLISAAAALAAWAVWRGNWGDRLPFLATLGACCGPALMAAGLWGGAEGRR